MFFNDYDNFIIQTAYGFSPARFTNTAHHPDDNKGKYEPDRNPCNDIRCMTLAHWFDHTNIIFKYKHSELVPP